jgi:hypothetical protein
MVKSLVKSSLAIPKKEEDNHMSSRRNWQNSVIPSIIARTIACNVFIYTFFGFLIWRGYSKPIKTVVGARRILLKLKIASL